MSESVELPSSQCISPLQAVLSLCHSVIFFVDSITSWLLPPKLFSLGTLEIIGQAEADEFFF